MKKLALTLCALAGFAANAQTASVYNNSTLYFQNQDTKVSGALWLDADGSYISYINRGVQTVVPQSAAGAFQYEGREGSYTLAINGATAHICLTPDTSTKFDYQSEKAGEVFAGPGCYDVPNLSPGGETIATAANNKNYKFWLLDGR